MIHELQQTFWVTSPKGLARAILLVDRGPEMDPEWCCIQHDEPYQGQIWFWTNIDLRVVKNTTLGRANAITG